MIFVADTHALVKYLLGILPKKADDVFRSSEKGETAIFIPTIVLAECYYLIQDKTIELDFEELIRRIETSDNFSVAPFTFEILKLFPAIGIKEIHDKIIVATAKHLNAAVITRDEAIKKSGLLEVVWD